MNDRHLKGLQDVEIPAPSPRARDDAIRASLQAFEQAEEKKAKAPQEIQPPVRLISTIIERTWEWTMRQRTAIAALAVAAIAVPVTWQYIDDLGVVDRKAPLVRRNERPVKENADKPGSNGQKLDRLADALKSLPKEKAVTEQRSDQEVSGQIATAKAPLRRPSPRKNVLITPDLRIASSDRKQGGRVKTLEMFRDAGERKRRAEHARVAVGGELAIGIGGGDLAQTIRANRDKFRNIADNANKSVAADPVSTFSIDVDTASYAFVRRMIEAGRLPDPNAVRVEEMINYFSYDYPRPESAEVPFQSSVAVYPTPWNSNTKLLHIGIKGHDIVPDKKPQSNLVFLIDVSGSMQSQDKLPLLKSAFRLLVNRLEPDDSVSIVTYAGRAGTVLEPTKVTEKRKILAALDRLNAGGSTAGAQGIRQAYALAEEAFQEQGVNRVILATDGDFNVGITDQGQLKSYIEAKRKTGIFLSVLGFGQGNYNDALMQTLAQNGNGNAAYIDSLKEAQKVLVEEAGSTLFPIAKDVKIQIEFNPARVSHYRLIGYETRALRREDFNNDKVDAGDIGSGHTVTAIYEITPVGATNRLVDDLRYGKPKPVPASDSSATASGEYAFLKLRYKLPQEDKSKLITLPVGENLEVGDVAGLSSDMRFAASVAAFGQKLRGNTNLGDFGFDAIAELALGARGNDPFGYRNEFVSLVRLSKAIAP